MKKSVLLGMVAVFMLLIGMPPVQASSEEKVDLTGLLETCPFVFKDKIKFGMTSQEVMKLEGALTLDVSLGGLDGYKLTYSFTDNKLTKIEYFFEWPIPLSMAKANRGEYSLNDLEAMQTWIDNAHVVKDALIKKYGETKVNKDTNGEEYKWAVTFDDSLWGVDIRCAMEEDEWRGEIWCNCVTYEPHSYQADLEGLVERNNLIDLTSDDL